MKTVPYIKDLLIDILPTIKEVIIYKTGSCGFTGDRNSKNGRVMGVVYKDGRQINCIYQD